MGDADITLRHVTRRRPGELARPFLPRRGAVEVEGWIDSQLTHLERRADKALRVRIDGEPRALHLEFFLTMRKTVPRRMFGYLGVLTLALDAEAGDEELRKIESVAVVLSGRKRRWPKWGKHRTAWPESRFSGAHFRIDAVYQRTVAELRARGSVLWLVFAPLARDATVKAMRAVVKTIRARAVDDEDRIDLFKALIAMANIDPWGYGLGQEIRAMLDLDAPHPRLVEIQREVDEWFANQWRKKACNEAREEVIRSLLGRIFNRRVGRQPSAVEQQALVDRARKLGAEQVEDALLDREGDALVQWLARPVRKPRAKAALQKKR